MPSFPTSVFAPTTKTTGQTIAAAHVNDLQDEVVAIEGGYINGTARLNSSNLNVTGTSTFASRPIMPPTDVARLGLAAAQEIPDGIETVINWTTQNIITNSSMHSTATNSSQVVPQSSGVYAWMAELRLRSGGSSLIDVIVRDSSGTFISEGRTRQSTTGSVSVGTFGMKRFDTVSSTQWVKVSVVATGSTNSVSAAESFFHFWKL